MYLSISGLQSYRKLPAPGRELHAKSWKNGWSGNSFKPDRFSHRVLLYLLVLSILTGNLPFAALQQANYPVHLLDHASTSLVQGESPQPVGHSSYPVPPAGISSLRTSIEGYGVQAQWVTDKSYRFVVEYGTTPQLGKTVPPEAFKVENQAGGGLLNRVALGGLWQVQYYQIKAFDLVTGASAYTSELQSLAPAPALTVEGTSGPGGSNNKPPNSNSLLLSTGSNPSDLPTAPSFSQAQNSAGSAGHYQRGQNQGGTTSLTLPPSSKTTGSSFVTGGPNSQLAPNFCYELKATPSTYAPAGPAVFYIVGNYLDSPYPTSWGFGPLSEVGDTWFGSLGGVVIPPTTPNAWPGIVSGGIGRYLPAGGTLQAVTEIPNMDLATNPAAQTYGWYCQKKTPQPKQHNDCTCQSNPATGQGGLIADPVNIEMGGSFEETFPLFSLSQSGQGQPIDLSAHYSSAKFASDIGSTRLGKGWTMRYDRYLSYEPLPAYPITATATPRWVLYDEDGGRYTYTAAGTGFLAEANNFTTLTQDATTGDLIIEDVSKNKDYYDATTGQLKVVEDSLGNRLNFTWITDTSVTPNVLLEQITSNRTGQSILLKHQLRYDPDSAQQTWRLTSIEDEASRGTEVRKVLLGYGAAVSGPNQDRLVTITDPAGNIKTFGYDDKGRINSYFDENNNPAVLGNVAKATTNTYEDPIYPMPSPVITTTAGTGTAASGGDGGSAANAQIYNPQAMATDKAGNLYIAEFGGHRVRKIEGATGVITTVAGNGTPGFSGDGALATSAQLNSPDGLAVGSDGTLYISDFANHRVRKVAPDGTITTIAGDGTAASSGDGGSATSARLNHPGYLVLDNTGNLYISEYSGHRVRKINAATGTITTVAGNGTAASSGDGGVATVAQLNTPEGLALDNAGNLYISEFGGYRVRKVAPDGTITTMAGDGTAASSGDGGSATNAKIDGPAGLAFDRVGNLYISEYNTNKVRMVRASDNTISTLVNSSGTAGFSGDNSVGTDATTHNPAGLAMDPTSSNLYLADQSNHRVRKLQVNRTEPGQRVSRQVLPNSTTVDFVWKTVNPPQPYDLEVIYNQGLTDERREHYQMQNGVTTAVGGFSTIYNRIKRVYPPNAFDSWTEYTYDAKGELQQVSNYPSNANTQYTYNATTGNLEQINQNGDVTLLAYDSFGNVTQHTDPVGNVTRYTYSPTTGAIQTESQVATLNGQLITQTTTYTTNSYGQITQITLPDNTQVTQDFDSLGYPTTTTYDAGTGGLALTESNTYDWRGWLTSSTDRQGTVTTYEYYPQGWLKAVVTDSSAAGRRVRSEYYYDNVGNMTRQIEDAGSGRLNATTLIDYSRVGTDGGYVATTITNPLNQVSHFGFTTYGELKTETDPANHTTTYDYYPQGWLKNIKLADGRVILTNTYNAAGQLIKASDGRGVTTEYEYDYKWRTTKVKYGTSAVGGSPALNHYTFYAYDKDDRVSYATDNGASGYTVYNATYDGFNRLATEADGQGNTTRYSYDNQRNWLALATYGANNSAEQTQLSYTYDRLGRRLQQVQDPCLTAGCSDHLNLTTTYAYTAPGSSDRWNLQQVTDPQGHLTRYSFNSLGQLAQVTDALNNKWGYTYNNLGYLTEMTDPSGIAARNTLYGVDLLGRTTSLTKNGQTEIVDYNPDSTVASHTSFGGIVTNYSYDSTRRLTQLGYSGPGVDPNSPTYPGATYTYLPNDLLATVTDKLGTTTYAYDAANRLTSRSRPDATGVNRPVSYAYNFDDSISKITYWDKGDVNYNYNFFSGQLTGLTPVWGATTSAALSYDYRSTGQLKSLQRPTNPGPAVTTNYGYDSAVRLTGLNAGAGNMNIQYPNRDANSAIISQTDNFGSAGYAYDPLQRLVEADYPALPGGSSAENTEFKYSRVGNLVYRGNPRTANPNLAANSGFESDFTGWSGSSGTTSITSANGEFYEGGKAAKISGSNQGVYQIVNNLVPDATYRLSGWGKPGSNGDTTQLFVKDFGSNLITSQFASDSGSFTSATLTFTLGVTNTTATIGAWKTAGAGDSLVDGLNLSQLYLNNSDFEAGLAGWAATSNVSLSTSGVFSGTQAAKVSGSGQILWQWVKGLKPNTSYRLSGWGKVTNSGESARLFAKDYGDSVVNVGVSSVGNYAQYSLTFTTGVTNTTATIGFARDSGSGTGDAYLDEVSLVPTLVANPDFEQGSQHWGLSANASVVTGSGSGAYNGAAALKLTATEAGNNGGGGWQMLSGLEPNTTYALSAQGKLTNSNDANGSVFLYAKDYGFSQVQAALPAGRDYGEQILFFTTGPTNTTATIGVWRLDGSGEAYVDGLEVVKVGYNYDASDHLTNAGFTYDGNGNLTRDDQGNTYRYDAADRLISSTVKGVTTGYSYDGLGNLVRQTRNEVTTDLILDENTGSYNRILGELNSGGNTDQLLYGYGPEGLAAQQQFVGGSSSGQGLEYAVLDQLGSVRQLLNTSGSVVKNLVYDSWGNVRYQDGSVPTTLGFSGERMNPDGTVYLRARMYLPSLGRFLQRDSLDPGLLGSGPQGHNRYSYVENNPANLTDPSGHQPVPSPSPSQSPSPSPSASPSAGSPFNRNSQEICREGFYLDNWEVETTEPDWEFELRIHIALLEGITGDKGKARADLIRKQGRRTKTERHSACQPNPTPNPTWCQSGLNRLMPECWPKSAVVRPPNRAKIGPIQRAMNPGDIAQLDGVMNTKKTCSYARWLFGQGLLRGYTPTMVEIDGKLVPFLPYTTPDPKNPPGLWGLIPGKSRNWAISRDGRVISF